MRVSLARATPSPEPASAATERVVEIDAVPAAVRRPCWSTVNVGILVDEPYDPGVTAVSSRSIVISLADTAVLIPVSPVNVTVS